jgi:hypothetical protein
MEKFLQPNFQLLQYCVRQKERTNILKKRTKKRQIHKEEQSKRNVKIRRLREQKVSQKKQKRI